MEGDTSLSLLGWCESTPVRRMHCPIGLWVEEQTGLLAYLLQQQTGGWDKTPGSGRFSTNTKLLKLL